MAKEWGHNPSKRCTCDFFSLDDRIPADSPVRLFEEILDEMDWSAWEAKYKPGVGRCAYKPSIIMGIILYGITKGVRSTRQLEELCIYNMEFQWLAHKQCIDHSTFCVFMKRFEKEIYELFDAFIRKLVKEGEIVLDYVTTDATTVKANSSPGKILTREGFELYKKGLKESIEKGYEELKDSQKKSDSKDSLNKDMVTIHKQYETMLQKKQAESLAKKERELEKCKEYEEAFEKVEKAMYETRSKNKPALPKTDPESRILKNKDGGSAPNYQPVVTTDSSGYVLDVRVNSFETESQSQINALNHIHSITGQSPEKVLADSAYGNVQNLKELEALGVIPVVPTKAIGLIRDDIGYREDPTVPIPEELLDKLPVDKKTGRWTREAFQLDTENDCFYCPMGKCIPKTTKEQSARRGGKLAISLVYNSDSATCQSCPHKSKCHSPTKKSRKIKRIENSDIVNQIAVRNKYGGKEEYKKRSPIAEGKFGMLKKNLNVRQVSRRGEKKVEIEIKTVFLACNIKKYVSSIKEKLWCMELLSQFG